MMRLGRRRMVPLWRLPRSHARPPAGLLASARRFGVREPVVLVEQDGQLAILDGHHRVAVARALGLETVAARVLRVR